MTKSTEQWENVNKEESLSLISFETSRDKNQVKPHFLSAPIYEQNDFSINLNLLFIAPVTYWKTVSEFCMQPIYKNHCLVNKYTVYIKVLLQTVAAAYKVYVNKL